MRTVCVCAWKLVLQWPIQWFSDYISIFSIHAHYTITQIFMIFLEKLCYRTKEIPKENGEANKRHTHTHKLLSALIMLLLIVLQQKVQLELLFR